jgi:hypothetical protein
MLYYVLPILQPLICWLDWVSMPLFRNSHLFCGRPWRA